VTDTVRFQNPRSWVLLLRVGGLALLAAAFGCLALPAVEPEAPLPVLIGVAAVGIGLAIPTLRLGWRKRSTVIEIGSDGVTLPFESRWTPWSLISELKERPIRQCVELRDRSGACVATLEYRAEGFADALRRVLDRAPIAVPEQDAFGEGLGLRNRPGMVALVAVIGLFAWIGWTADGAGGLWIAAATVVAVGARALRDVNHVSLGTDGIAIRRGLRTSVCPWREVAQVELGLTPIGRGTLALDLFLVRTSGARERIRPAGANPIHLERRIAARLARARAPAAR
jgi:hypothetical protein